MCTRYALDITIDELREIMEAAERSPLTMKFIDTHARPLVTDGEVRPTDIVPVIAPNSKGVKSVFPMQWGFMARDNKRTLFNARVETAGEKPTFKDAWQSHRCIIPAAYYYEWAHLKSPDGKVQTGDKYAIQPTGCTTTWLCGLYRIEEGYPVFVILTQEPTEELGKIHDRMPVMLPKDKIEQWINPTSNPRDLISQTLTDMVIEKATSKI
ncbi:SOS response-associated peptidase [Butyrivibrio fibrisolvens]|uniref:SOS response-associated peptidase n=1 Tax=Pseudobutyrivibrio ruminis TaxID=46206 RepID=UPI0004258831|nr:SOS response-associated peptidase family protein [Pseudobutyrivibrio ruminis]MDC7278102.1 SOS response-associated peptidase [Butyrivibrio fibrisolvens]